MKAGVEDRVSMSDTLVTHFDTCLGCMACETACPSGVRYAPLVEETRAAIEHHHRRPLFDRLFRFALFSLLPYPARLRLLVLPLAAISALGRWPRVLSLLPRKIGSLIALAPSVRLKNALRDRLPVRTAAAGAPRLRVGLLTGCVQRVFFGHINEASARVLAAEGCEVLAPLDQGCCGALALHAGRDEEARGLSRRLIAAFERTGVDQVVVNAAGCGSAMKTYGQLLKGESGMGDARAHVLREST